MKSGGGGSGSDAKIGTISPEISGFENYVAGIEGTEG